MTKTLILLALVLLGPAAPTGAHANQPDGAAIPATAYAIPRETAPEGEGYFSIVEGHNQRLYIGTHANAKNSWLVEFDPVEERMEVVVDAHKAIGTDATGFGAQAKIHTRNNVGASGRIYFGTKQGYPAPGEPLTAYPGGYPMTYDPRTGRIEVFPIPVAHHGVISITPDEARDLFYVSTCSDSRPIDHTHFLLYDRKTAQYTDLMDCEHMYAFIVVDHAGRAYHPIRGGDIARYDPDTKQLDRLTQTIDGHPPAPESHLRDENSHPINWDISPDRKTLYAQPMSGNALYAYDLTAAGDTLPGRFLGPLIPGAERTDCRALCAGPSGTVWCAVTTPARVGDGRRIAELHLVRYRLGTDAAPRDLGTVFVANPGFKELTDEDGEPLPGHGGFLVLESGRMVPRHVNLGVCEARDGSVYSLALQPYTLLKVSSDVLETLGPPGLSQP